MITYDDMPRASRNAIESIVSDDQLPELVVVLYSDGWLIPSLTRKTERGLFL